MVLNEENLDYKKVSQVNRLPWKLMEIRRVLLSLNTLDDDGKLLCRTLFEKDLDEILLKNNHACRIVLDAMKVFLMK